VRQALKVIHFIGLAMFLGSVFAHISVNAVPGVGTDPAATLTARQAIVAATTWVTLPGLLLAIASGLGLTILGGHGFGRTRWLTLHQAAALLVLLNAVLVLAPAGREAVEAARSGSMETVAAAAAPEGRFGPVNLLLTLAAVVLAVAKPRLGQRREP
jgi:hypothetical protein